MVKWYQNHPRERTVDEVIHLPDALRRDAAIIACSRRPRSSGSARHASTVVRDLAPHWYGPIVTAANGCREQERCRPSHHSTQCSASRPNATQRQCGCARSPPVLLAPPPRSAAAPLISGIASPTGCLPEEGADGAPRQGRQRRRVCTGSGGVQFHGGCAGSERRLLAAQIPASAAGVRSAVEVRVASLSPSPRGHAAISTAVHLPPQPGQAAGPRREPTAAKA